MSDSLPLLRLPQKTSPLPSTLAYTSPTGYRAPGGGPGSSMLTGSLPAAVAGNVGNVNTDQLTSMETLVAPSTVQPLRVGVGWHPGFTRMRRPNEDSVVVLQGTCTYLGKLMPFGLFVVADGMGGHACGEEASRLAMQSMMHTVMQSIVMGHELSDEFLTDMLIGGVDWANQAVNERARILGKDMGTTLTAALVVGTRVYVVNVGDSRTYLYRPGAGLAQITRDHSLVATLVLFGELAPDDVYTHPERNKVYRSLGSKESVEVDWHVVDLYHNDTLLLCSDGLWEMVRDPEIERILRYGYDPSYSCDMLVKAALRGGGVDNISVITAYLP